MKVRAGEAYVVLYAMLSLYWLVPNEPNALAFYALLVAAFPVSIAGYFIQYVGGILVFGPEQDGLLVRSASFILWVVVATVQMVAVRAIIREARRGRAARAP